jgi:hypothetical protein
LAARKTAAAARQHEAKWRREMSAWRIGGGGVAAASAAAMA